MSWSQGEAGNTPHNIRCFSWLYRSTYTAKEKVVFERYFTDRVVLDCIERTPAAPYLDAFVSALKEGGYSKVTIQRYVRSAAHLSHWQQQRGQALTDLDERSVREFKKHLRRCRCKGFRRVND